MTDADRDKLLAFMRQELYAVQASVSVLNAPQAAIVAIVVSDRFEVFFDTLTSSRKALNLRHNSAAALVIGPASAGAERTVQLEGAADEPTGTELERLLELYFARFPDGVSASSGRGSPTGGSARRGCAIAISQSIQRRSSSSQPPTLCRPSKTPHRFLTSATAHCPRLGDYSGWILFVFHDGESRPNRTEVSLA